MGNVLAAPLGGHGGAQPQPPILEEGGGAAQALTRYFNAQVRPRAPGPFREKRKRAPQLPRAPDPALGCRGSLEESRGSRQRQRRPETAGAASAPSAAAAATAQKQPRKRLAASYPSCPSLQPHPFPCNSLPPPAAGLPQPAAHRVPAPRPSRKRCGCFGRRARQERLPGLYGPTRRRPGWVDRAGG